MESGAARGTATAATGAAPVVDAALFTLFRERERAAGVVLWADRGQAGPVFTALAGLVPDAEPAAPPPRVPAPLARDTATLVDLEALFAAAPDGWAAFRRRWPFFAGLVEVGPVRRIDDSTRTVVVGRSCGDHCRSAWRVVVDAGTTGDPPVVRRVEALRVPGDR